MQMHMYMCILYILGTGITPKPPSGHHASVGTTQQIGLTDKLKPH